MGFRTKYKAFSGKKISLMVSIRNSNRTHKNQRQICKINSKGSYRKTKGIGRKLAKTKKDSMPLWTKKITNSIRLQNTMMSWRTKTQSTKNLYNRPKLSCNSSKKPTPNFLSKSKIYKRKPNSLQVISYRWKKAPIKSIAGWQHLIKH